MWSVGGDESRKKSDPRRFAVGFSLVCTAVAVVSGCGRRTTGANDNTVLKYVAAEKTIPNVPGNYDNWQKLYCDISQYCMYFEDDKITVIYCMKDEEEKLYYQPFLYDIDEKGEIRECDDLYLNEKPENISEDELCKLFWQGGSLTEGTVQMPDGGYAQLEKEGFYVNTGGIYDSESNTVFSFSDNGYYIETIEDFRVNGEEYELLVSMDKRSYYMRVYKDYVTETRTELVLATGYINTSLKMAVSAFNRSNRDYYVTIEQMDAITEQESYFGEIQKRFASGDAPDIFTDDAVPDIDDFIINGYIAPVTVEIDLSDIQAGSLTGLSYDGILYGIPYDCQLKLVCYSEAFAGGKDSVTAQEFMNLVNSYGAQILVCGMDGTDIILNFFLSDNDNTSYIDWKNKESHLCSEEFIEVLHFAKKYADTYHSDIEKGRPIEDEAEYLNRGDACGIVITIDDIMDMNYLDAVFTNGTSALGYPTVNGNGVYIETRNLYGSASSKHPDGVREFLTYVTGVEMQERAVDWEMPTEGIVGNIPLLPIRLSVVDYMISKGRYVKHMTKWNRGNGVKYIDSDLTDEQVALFLKIYEGAESSDWNINDISYIFEEELPPFFEGVKSAQETAEILDSRVWIFLNE